MNLSKLMSITVLVSCFSIVPLAGDPKTIHLGFTPDFIDFSPDDRYMVAENENQYVVLDTKVNRKVLEGKYTFKIALMFVKHKFCPLSNFRGTAEKRTKKKAC